MWETFLEKTKQSVSIKNNEGRLITKYETKEIAILCYALNQRVARSLEQYGFALFSRGCENDI